MATLPLALPPQTDPLPEYLPARMVNEFVYCPRLFFYEWVEGVFQESADTIEGNTQHRRVDKEGGALPAAEDLDEDLKTQAITLSSERLKVIAKMDIVQVENGRVRPLDYKKGSPKEGADGPEMWPADRVQVVLQALVLRENGYVCDEAVVYYRGTNQKVRVPLTDAVIEEATAAVYGAWRTSESSLIPAPLVDSPKCPGCSLHSICLPDETNALAYGELEEEADDSQLRLFAVGFPQRKPAKRELRRLIVPREDRKPLYLNTQGLRVGKSGEVLQVKEKDAVRQEVRLNEICQLNVMGNIQITTQAIQALCGAEIPVSYFSQGGWFYGMTSGLSTKNVFLRQGQFRLATEEWFALRLARKLVAAKIRNQRVMVMRNHEEPPKLELEQMREMAERAESAESLASLLGIEGNGARLYFGSFAGMIKIEPEEAAPFDFDFTTRNRRPPKDPVNALLSLGYSLLSKDLTVACASVGFDPMMGFYHQPRFGRPALALDLMEPFRPLIVESAVLTAINTRMVGAGDFVRTGRAVALTAGGRRSFFQAYEARMDTLVTHPEFGYRLSYRRLLEVQARLLARVITGELSEYIPFVTR